MPDAEVGYVFDVGGSLPDLQDFYPANEHEGLDSERFKKLMKDLDQLQAEKNEGGSSSHGGKGRNYWQGVQAGGEGEPFYRDPDVSALFSIGSCISRADADGVGFRGSRRL